MLFIARALSPMEVAELQNRQLMLAHKARVKLNPRASANLVITSFFNHHFIFELLNQLSINMLLSCASRFALYGYKCCEF